MTNAIQGTVLVTGASGQLGRRLVPRLISSGYNVKAHYRSESKARKYCPPDVVPVYGDLIEPRWLDEAIRGCDIVIHGAALVSMRPGREELARRINIDGTKAVLSACAVHHVKRLIYISSIITIGISEDGEPVDESMSFNLENSGIPYIDTKREAERMALEFDSAELGVIVVNPSIMISPPDRELTPRDLKKIPRHLPFYFDFGINLVETDDVISGIIAAIDKGKPGERYLLTGTNIGPVEVFELARKHLGIRKPFIRIPYAILYLIAILSEWRAKILRKRPKFHRGLARMAKFRLYYSCEKAERELGYKPKPISESIENIVRLLRR